MLPSLSQGDGGGGGGGHSGSCASFTLLRESSLRSIMCFSYLICMGRVAAALLYLFAGKLCRLLLHGNGYVTVMMQSLHT